MILHQVVIQPIEKPRSVGPHKSISKKIDNKKKARPENKKFRSVNKLLYGIHVDPDNDDDNVPQQRLLFTSENKTNYSSINISPQLPGRSQKIDHTLLVIYQSLAVYHILVPVKGLY